MLLAMDFYVFIRFDCNLAGTLGLRQCNHGFYAIDAMNFLFHHRPWRISPGS
jgi:hypothetical protein